MVVRSAQKNTDDIQRIREAMEGHRPVIPDGQRELIIKQVNIIGEDGAAMVEDIKDAAASTTIKTATSRCLQDDRQMHNFPQPKGEGPCAV